MCRKKHLKNTKQGQQLPRAKETSNLLTDTAELQSDTENTKNVF